MIILQNYWLAILFCVFAMICWGSWSNTQKMVQNNWRFELFYWDLIIGILLMSLLAEFTVGSMGESGRSFIDDVKQADASSIVFAMLGGLLWNLGNLLLVASIAVAGMSVAFGCFPHWRRAGVDSGYYSELHQRGDERWSSKH